MLGFKVLKRSQGYRAAPIYTGNQRLDTAYPTSHSPVPQELPVRCCGAASGAGPERSAIGEGRGEEGAPAGWGREVPPRTLKLLILTVCLERGLRRRSKLEKC